jgi:hypothetical protein
MLGIMAHYPSASAKHNEFAKNINLYTRCGKLTSFFELNCNMKKGS